MLEVATQVSADVSITCVDVSPHLFPKAAPPNVAFAQHSALALPADWSGRFDFVHQRLLVFALRTDQWMDNIRELFRVTKPGGWAQLCEVSWPDIVPRDTPHARFLHGIHFKLAESRGLDMSCARRLEERMTEAGFCNVEVKIGCVPMGALAGDGPHNGTYPFISYFTGALKVQLTAPTPSSH